MGANTFVTITVKEYAALQRILGTTRGTFADGATLFPTNEAWALVVRLIREYEKTFGAVRSV